MYSPYAGDAQYPHGPELGSMHGQIPVDPSGAPARYPYVPYYGPKGPDSAQLAAAMAQRPHYSGEYPMGTPEAMYNPGWSSLMAGQAGYMGGKPGHYGVQVSKGKKNFVACKGYTRCFGKDQHSLGVAEVVLQGLQAECVCVCIACS